MSSSGATGGDQCNRRRLREQPRLKVMPTDARQKSAGTGQGRPGWRRLESTTMEVYTPAHTPMPRNFSSADRMGRQLSMQSRHQPSIHRWSESHRERARRMAHMRLPGGCRASA